MPPGNSMEKLEKFVSDHRITEVECLVPDMNGIARGKILPDEKFLKGLANHGLRLPEVVFMQTVTGECPRDEDVSDDAVSDVYLQPDPDTICSVPWYEEPTAQVICDCEYADGSAVEISSRHVLRLSLIHI